MKTKENGRLTAEKTAEAAENRHFSDRRKKRYIIAFASAAVVAVAAGILLLISSGAFDNNNGSDVKVPTNSVSEHSTEIFIEDVYEHERYSDEYFEASTTTTSGLTNEYYDKNYSDYYRNEVAQTQPRTSEQHNNY